MTSHAKTDTLVIVLLNLLPLVGVALWDWHAFDLLFLYWLENVVIGVFFLLRLLVRPYRHGIDLVVPLVLVPFFAVHYGLFCWVHGQFVLGLFAPDSIANAGLLQQVAAVLATPSMLAAALSLVALQGFDWLRDLSRRGPGIEGIRSLMTGPYRRIVVLHVVLLGGGFAVTALGEPMLGLLALVVAKTASDLYHARRDDRAADRAGDSGVPLRLSAEKLAELDARFSEPKVTVNGRDKHFDSFAELKSSSEFRMMCGIMRLMGAGSELALIETYLDRKIADEER